MDSAVGQHIPAKYANITHNKNEAQNPRLPDSIDHPIAVIPPSRMQNSTLAMPLIEDLSRYGIEDCSYSPEAQKATPNTEYRVASMLYGPKSDQACLKSACDISCKKAGQGRSCMCWADQKSLTVFATCGRSIILLKDRSRDGLKESNDFGMQHFKYVSVAIETTHNS
ncbi:uncharacterized protein TNCV_2274621 [Trichonephila clavipes]|nr:uncharacterized protein TNCV_2274621 [Trichonephila clavipes]